jgi:4-amino-4-deoxy-L-arabinose transferase-like glycosyltransferase
MIDFHFVTSRRKTVLILLAICGLALLPFLGIADFNTKGEPREAVVAFSILEQENWILPTNNGGEIPYKPPFLHWCIAAVSLLLNGGIVNEYTSRLPSAIALIAMTATIFLFFSKKSQNKTALGTALLMFTAFEIYRAGMNCRVDMMLTALTVGAIVSLFRWWERGMRGFPVIAILLMSAATLTKGPVGIIIPCLTAGIFMLLRGVPFFKAFIWLSLWGVLSLILPLCWYLAAYQQGGKEFLDLVMEENFGRMTGTMAYESHLNPWYYNIVTLLAGFLPWTITAVIALFVIPRHAYSEIAGRLHDISGRLRRWLRETSPRTLLALTAVIVIFIFYCIPASKRSVYLMPLYPFLAYFLARMLMWMSHRRPGSVRGYGDFIAVIGIVLFAAYISIKCGLVPDSLFGHGKHAAQNAAMLHSLRDFGGIGSWIWAAVAPVCSIIWWYKVRNKVGHGSLPVSTALLVVSLYISISGCYQPAVLQAKSVKGMTAEMALLYPDMKSDTYEFMSMAEEAKGNPMHFFEINFYLGDRIRNFRKSSPDKGYLLIGEKDAEEYLPEFQSEGYEFDKVYTPAAGLPRHTPLLYRFIRKKAKEKVPSVMK